MTLLLIYECCEETGLQMSRKQFARVVDGVLERMMVCRSPRITWSSDTVSTHVVALYRFNAPVRQCRNICRAITSYFDLCERVFLDGSHQWYWKCKAVANALKLRPIDARNLKDSTPEETTCRAPTR